MTDRVETRKRLRSVAVRWMAVAALLLTGLGCAPLAARAQAAQGADAGPEPAKMMAKDADPDWEVATVKPSDPNDKNRRFNVDGRHIAIENQTAEAMLLFAYGKQKSQIIGAPEWFGTERFNADGVPDVEGEPSMKQFQGMVQKLFAERFGLKMHTEQREMPVFALTVAKGGAKLSASAGDPNGSNHNVMKFTNNTMEDFALCLDDFLDRPVVDQTGLTGQYDFQLKWTQDEMVTGDPNALPGIFTAIQEQLGLKLVPVKAQADVIVIDHVERPSAN